MKKINTVYIAQSIDGYIADRNGGLDWLHSIPNPDNLDFGFADFLTSKDAIVMGRVTFETVLAFDGEWPYPIPVYVLSNSLTKIPEEYQDNVELVNGDLSSVLAKIHAKNHTRLYIDGGTTIQSFLKQDLIDELIISTIPVLLGDGTPLFSELSGHLNFEHSSTKIFLDTIVQSHYKRKR